MDMILDAGRDTADSHTELRGDEREKMKRQRILATAKTPLWEWSTRAGKPRNKMGYGRGRCNGRSRNSGRPDVICFCVALLHVQRITPARGPFSLGL